MLLRFAKISGGLRAVVTEAGPIIGTSIGLLSARSIAYVLGFTLANIISSWLPIIATLISIAGFFNGGSNTPECEAYRAQMRAIDASNRALMASYQLSLAPYIAASNAYSIRYMSAIRSLAPSYNSLTICADACRERCTYYRGSTCGFLCWGCYQDVSNRFYAAVRAAAGTPPTPPPSPTLQTYPACSAPNCPAGKKVWTQVVWASPNETFTEAKGCYIVAYSQDAPTLPPRVEYNPFLPTAFVESRALSYYLVNGDRYRGLRDNEWTNLESVSGWDKGYWRSEVTDPECRGWRPGWSRKVK
jgi:hypothetical protein